MKKVEQPSPDNYYIFVKKFLDPHAVIQRGEVSWAIQKPVENLGKFFLPMAYVLGFSIVDSQLIIVFKFHPEEIIRKLPRMVRHMNYTLCETEMQEYLSGKMPPICRKDKQDCQEGKIEYHLLKKISNYLHSTTIHYNKHISRDGCLFARKANLYLLETEDEIQNAIAQTQIVPLIFGDKNPPEKCKTNSAKAWTNEHKNFICWTKIDELFATSKGGLIGMVRKIYKRINKEIENITQLISRIPGQFFRENIAPDSG